MREREMREKEMREREMRERQREREREREESYCRKLWVWCKRHRIVRRSRTCFFFEHTIYDKLAGNPHTLDSDKVARTRGEREREREK